MAHGRQQITQAKMGGIIENEHFSPGFFLKNPLYFRKKFPCSQAFNNEVEKVSSNGQIFPRVVLMYM